MTVAPGAGDALFVEVQEALKGRYSLLDELGRGGMGVVYLAHEVALDRPVAVKVLPPEFARLPGRRERFLREARAAAQLSHPNIVPIHAVEDSGRFVWYAMAYVDGETLSERVRARGPLPPLEAAALLRDVARALGYAHARGVVHRDVKPDNILIERGSLRPMVTDFGIARLMASSSDTGVAVGTPEYMSPEQASGEPVDGRSDLYAIGAVAWFALAGRPPFVADDVRALLAKHISAPVPSLADVAPGIPLPVARQVDRCLAKAPADRPATGEELAEALDAALERPRQLPAPLERWLAAGDELRLRHVMVAPLVATPVLTMIGLALSTPFSRGGVALSDLALFVAGVAGPFAVYGLHRLLQTRGVLRGGFTAEDLRLAIQAWRERQAARDRDDPAPPTRTERLTRWGLESGFGVGLVLLGAAVTKSCGTDDGSALYLVLYGSYTAGAAGVVIARLARGPGRNLSGLLDGLRQRFWGGRLGRWLTKLAGAGLPAGTARFAHRQTEVALGSAAAALFEALPKELRAELREVPAVIEDLERKAGLVRERMAELDRMRTEAARAGRAGTAAAQRRQLEGELGAARASAERRLTDLVSALETVRLDLIRLRAGTATAAGISADLEAARRVGAEMDALAEAREGVERLLGAAPTPT